MLVIDEVTCENLNSIPVTSSFFSVNNKRFYVYKSTFHTDKKN